MFGLGTWEIVIVFAIILIIFGPKSLPKIGQSLGKGIREFKDATAGIVNEDYDSNGDDTDSSAKMVEDEEPAEDVNTDAEGEHH